MLSSSARPHLSFLKHQPAGAPGVRLASCLPPHNTGSPGMKDQVYSNSGLQLGGQDKACRGSCDTLTCSRVNSPPSTLKIETQPVCLYPARFPIQLVVRLNTLLFLPPISLVPRREAARDTTQQGFWGKDQDFQAQTSFSAHPAADRCSEELLLSLKPLDGSTQHSSAISRGSLSSRAGDKLAAKARRGRKNKEAVGARAASPCRPSHTHSIAVGRCISAIFCFFNNFLLLF